MRPVHTVTLRQWWKITQCWDNHESICKRKKLDYCIATAQQLTQCKALNLPALNSELLVENIGVTLYDLVLGFSDLILKITVRAEEMA